MIQEALEYLRGHLLKQQAPQEVQFDGPKDRRTYIMPDGEVRVVQAEDAPLRLWHKTLAGFASDCKKLRAGRVYFSSCGDVSKMGNVFDSIVADLDRAGREKLILPLCETMEFTALDRLLDKAKERNSGIGTRELCFNLRSDLRNCFDQDTREDLLSKFGKLKVVTSEGGGSSSSRTQDTMGAEIDRQISGDVDLPTELITFKTTVFTVPELINYRYPLTVYVEPNLDTKTWILRALPDERHRVRAMALDALKQKLDAMLGKEMHVDL